MVIWILELTGASYLLSYGAEHMSKSFGTRFVGRTLLSVATTLPEIAIVAYAAAGGFYDTAISSALGSNLLMMTLGLSIMLLIATTRLSKAPLKAIDAKAFKLDKYLLIITAVASLVMFMDGFDFIDGIIFSAMFGAYLYLAYREMLKERVSLKAKLVSENSETHNEQKKKTVKAVVTFAIGTTGIFLGAEPFIHALEGTALDHGISVAILAIIISPVAGEMPEKISMMILARKGAAGASIAVANVLGSKILNNTLLLAVAIFGGTMYRGFTAEIPITSILWYQIVLVTVITIVALIPMLRDKLDLKSGILLLALYIIGIGIQFYLPQ
ncbi:MAG: hypothetical protein QXU32_06125 [Nitrososphaerales archaeon]